MLVGAIINLKRIILSTSETGKTGRKASFLGKGINLGRKDSTNVLKTKQAKSVKHRKKILLLKAMDSNELSQVIIILCNTGKPLFNYNGMTSYRLVSKLHHFQEEFKNTYLNYFSMAFLVIHICYAYFKYL